MAPSKRSRTVDEEQNEVIVTDQASSNLRQNSTKRARISGPGERRSSTTLSSEVSSDIEDEPAVPAVPVDANAFLPPSTQYEIERDAGFKHLQNEERDDERATQAILARNQALGENRPAENGIIESIECINFMCHERMKVQLGPLINFIVGMNGSGKSAVLTGITLCLGGKASTTSRGGSLKSFVKEGREQAALIVKIANRGVDAYQPDIYGESIIVERHFSKSGTSGFKLKSSGGKVISNKKGDLEDIVEHFQMQIDNPMNVLTQDAARQFLNSSTPAQKYKFFVKGVQLEQLDNDYKLLRETTDNILEKIYVQKDNVKVLEDVKNAAEEKRKLIAKHESMRTRARQLVRQCAWAQVEEQERELAARERVVLEMQEKIDEAERAAEMKAAEFQQAHDHTERAEEALRIVTDELVPLKEEQAEAKIQYDNNRRELEETQQTQRQVREFMRSAKTKIIRYEKDIEDEQQRLDKANGGAHTQLLTDFENAKSKVADAKTSIENHSNGFAYLQQNRQAAEVALRKANEPIGEKQKEIRLCEEQLHELKKKERSSMAGFEPTMSSLLSMISKETKFREKPIGPVGNHIRLLQPIWSTILEKSMGQFLNAFIVTSHHDQELLSRMMRQARVFKSPIVIGNNNPLNTHGHEPDEQHNTILRVLEIDNDLVRKQLIIAQQIEQTILIESRQSAARVMSEGARPVNVRQCFAIHESHRGWGVAFGFGAGGGNKSSPIQGNLSQRPRIKTDIDSQIAFRQDTLSQLQQDLRDFRSRHRAAEQDLDRCKQAIEQHKRRKLDLEVALQRANQNFDNLQEELDRDDNQDGKLEALQENLREQQQELTQYEGTFQECVLSKERLNGVSVGSKKVLDGIRVRIADHEITIQKAQQKVNSRSSARSLSLQEKNKAIEVIDEAKAEKERADHKRDREAQTVIYFTQEASKISTRVPIEDGETPDSLDTKLDTLQKRIKEYNAQAGGTDEEINNAASEALQNWRAAVKQIESMEQMCDLLKETFENRQQRWRKFQQLISARSRIMFVYLLSERGFRGKLMIDHKSQLLDLNIEPDETIKGNKGRATKTLSGGEKSFSSICLLLALWEAMGAPLRCLDEFDVFMDQVNRDITTQMIITAARRSVGRQFILITPNAINKNVADDRDVKLIMLTDPRQTHLQQGIDR